MSTLSYPGGALAADLLRGGGGAALVSIPLAAGEPPAWLAAVLLLAVALFLVYGVSAAMNLRRRFELDEEGIRVLPGGDRLDWGELDALDLRYYSTRRDGRDGWMQLRLRCGNRAVRVDSRLSGFPALIARASRAARERGLPLTPATLSNLSALGIRLPESAP